MKNVFILLVLTVFTSALFADNTKTVDVIKTKNETLFVKNIRTTINGFIVTTFDGEKKKFEKEEVTSYTKDGQQFDRVKIVEGECCLDKTCFMEFITYKNGFKVYKYEFCTDDGKITSRHLVFKDDKYIVKIDEKNKENLMAFFELK